MGDKVSTEQQAISAAEGNTKLKRFLSEKIKKRHRSTKSDQKDADDEDDNCLGHFQEAQEYLIFWRHRTSDNKSYRIALDVACPQPDNGTPIIGLPIRGTKHQQYTFHRLDHKHPYYFIKNAHSNKYLELREHTLVQNELCITNAFQQFQCHELPQKNAFTIRVRGFGDAYCLDGSDSKFQMAALTAEEKSPPSSSSASSSSSAATGTTSPKIAAQRKFYIEAYDVNKHKVHTHCALREKPRDIRQLFVWEQRRMFLYLSYMQRTLFPSQTIATRHMVPPEIAALIFRFYCFVIRFVYASDFDRNGLVYWLGCEHGTRQREWRNPCLSGYVHCSASSIMYDSEEIHSVVGRECVRFVTKPTFHAWIGVRFTDVAVIPTHYSLKHYRTWETECLRNWRLEAKHDAEEQWHVLMTHRNDRALDGRGDTHTWRIPRKNNPAQRAFTMFRIYQTGLNSNRHLYLACSGLEIYGVVLEPRMDRQWSTHYKLYCGDEDDDYY